MATERLGPTGSRILLESVTSRHKTAQKGSNTSWNLDTRADLCRQSWPTRVDMHQDIEGSLAASSISHAGGPQSPARSAENLLNGHRPKGLMELGRRDESVTDAAAPMVLVG